MSTTPISDAWEAWCPSTSIWAQWAKPLLFAMTLHGEATTPEPKPLGDLSWLDGDMKRTFVIVEAPGAEGVAIGLVLAQRGFRPVPLYNGVQDIAALIDVRVIRDALVANAKYVASLALPPEAPPAFLIDARRMKATPAPRTFDNRWVVIPEDFPSANRLLSRGLDRCVLLDNPTHDDLEHVLARYRDAGIAIEVVSGGTTRPYHATRPSKLVSLFRRLTVQWGLRRSSAGGFGGLVPEPQESSGS